MKKESTKSIAKQARQAAKKSIQISLITQLKAFVAKLGHSSKKIEKEIEKSAKQLSKKLSKPVKADKPALPNPVEKKALAIAKAPNLVIADTKTTTVASTPKPVKKVVAEKSSPAKKVVK